MEWLCQFQALPQAGMQEWMHALASYFDMLAKHSTLFPETCPPLPTAAACRALLGTLSMLLNQSCIQNKDAARPRKERAGHNTAGRASTAESTLADTVKEAKDAALALSLLEDGVAAVEAMQNSPVWIPILAEVASTERAGGDQAKGSSSLQNLRDVKKWGTVLPNNLGRRVVACFKTLASAQPSEASVQAAETAFEQLMEEEDQAAAKAAAKKAKKERQKAKKLLSPAKPATNAQAATASAKPDPDSSNNSFQLETEEFNQLALSFSAAGDLLKGFPDHPSSDKDLQHSSTPGSSAFASLVKDMLSAAASSHGLFPADNSSAAAHGSYNMSSQADTIGAHSQQMASSSAWAEAVDGTDKPVGSPFEDAQFLQSLFCCPLTQECGVCPWKLELGMTSSA